MPPGVAITASGCDSMRLLERASLVAAVGSRAEQVVDLGEPVAGDAFDLAIEFDERHAASLREHRAERRLAGAAQADQRDALLARLGSRAVAEQVRERDARAPQRGVVAAVQQVADQQPFGRCRCRRRAVRPAGTRARPRPAAARGSTRCRRRARGSRDGAPTRRRDRQRPSRHALARAQRAHPLAERDEEGSRSRVAGRASCRRVALPVGSLRFPASWATAAMLARCDRRRSTPHRMHYIA